MPYPNAVPFPRTLAHAPALILTALLTLLLTLPTHATLIHPPQTPRLHFLNSPLSHTLLTATLPPGITTQTRLLTCPTRCILLLRHSLSHPIPTTFRIRPVLPLTPSARTRALAITLPRKRVHETRARTLPPGVYRLVLTAENPSPAVVTGPVTYALQRQLAECPIVLPTVLAPSPTPSPSPSPSPRARATPTPAADDGEAAGGDAEDALVEESRTSLSRQDVTPRIVGGNIPDPSLRSHMVAFIQNGGFTCSGSLISSRWALTAAHCGITAGSRATLGGATVRTGELVTVSAVFSHPGFDRSRTDSPYDIAVILFDRAAPEGTAFIRINTNNSVPIPGAYARVAGYGDTLQRSITTLRQVDIPVVSMSRCKAAYSRAIPLTARRLDERLQLCAGLLRGGCDACQGDSGGPLALFDSAGHLVQIGIVSFGIGCARAGFPGVHTRLSTFESFLQEVGAGYTRSTDGMVIFSAGSAEAAADGGFSIAGLTPTQTILVLAGIALVAGVLVFLGLVGLVRGRRRRRSPPPPQMPVPHDIDGAEYTNAGGFGGYNPAEQGLYPGYGYEYQHAGYPATTTQPTTTQPAPAGYPAQPPPVAREGFVAEPAEGNRQDSTATATQDDPGGTGNSLYPQNTVLTR